MAEKLFKNQMPDIPRQDDKWSNADSLGAKIEKAFTRFIQRVILWGYEFFAELMVQIFDASMKILQPGATRSMKPFIDEIRKQEGLPTWFSNMLDAIENEQGESKILMKIFGEMSVFLGIMGGGMQPFGRTFAQGVDSHLRSNRPSVNELVEFFRRGAIESKTYKL